MHRLPWSIRRVGGVRHTRSHMAMRAYDLRLRAPFSMPYTIRTTVARFF